MQLVSMEEGTLVVAVNDGNESSSFIQKASKKIMKGSNSANFDFDAIPRKWGNGIDFKISVFVVDKDSKVLFSSDKIIPVD